MNFLAKLKAPAAETVTLDQLFTTAEGYGAVRIWSQTKDPLPNRYHCKIEFATAAGTSLEANSDFHLSLYDALKQAIERAEMIACQFKRRA